MMRPVVAMVTDDTIAVLRPHVDAFAERISDGAIPGYGDKEAYAWGAVLGAFARSLECGDNSIEWADA